MEYINVLHAQNAELLIPRILTSSLKRVKTCIEKCNVFITKTRISAINISHTTRGIV